MSALKTSDIVWAAWLLLFLVLELTAFFRVVPWTTLSRAAWLNENMYPLLKTLLFGFLIGLAVHIRFGTGLWRTTAGGILIAFVLNFLFTK